MVEFGFVQTVEDNMKLYSKRQISGAVQAREFFEKMIYPSTLNLKVIVSAGDIPGCKVTPENVKTVEVIWGCLVLKIKGNTVRKNAKCMMQSIIMVPKELIKLQQDVELATTASSSASTPFSLPTARSYACPTIMHLTFLTKALIWEALHARYKMYLPCGFRIIVIKGDQEFSLVGNLIGNLPTAPKLDWAAAS